MEPVSPIMSLVSLYLRAERIELLRVAQSSRHLLHFPENINLVSWAPIKWNPGDIAGAESCVSCPVLAQLVSEHARCVAGFTEDHCFCYPCWYKLNAELNADNRPYSGWNFKTRNQNWLSAPKKKKVWPARIIWFSTSQNIVLHRKLTIINIYCLLMSSLVLFLVLLLNLTVAMTL